MVTHSLTHSLLQRMTISRGHEVNFDYPMPMKCSLENINLEKKKPIIVFTESFTPKQQMGTSPFKNILAWHGEPQARGNIQNKCALNTQQYAAHT